MSLLTEEITRCRTEVPTGKRLIRWNRICRLPAIYAAAAVTGGRALVRHVHMDNTQGDLRFLEVLEHMGCTADDTPEGVRVTGPADGALRGITVNMNDFSDQALTLAAIAPFADAPVRTYPRAGMRPDSRDTDEPDSAWHPV